MIKKKKKKIISPICLGSLLICMHVHTEVTPYPLIRCEATTSVIVITSPVPRIFIGEIEYYASSGSSSGLHVDVISNALISLFSFQPVYTQPASQAKKNNNSWAEKKKNESGLRTLFILSLSDGLTPEKKKAGGLGFG